MPKQTKSKAPKPEPEPKLSQKDEELVTVLTDIVGGKMFDKSLRHVWTPRLNEIAVYLRDQIRAGGDLDIDQGKFVRDWVIEQRAGG